MPDAGAGFSPVQPGGDQVFRVLEALVRAEYCERTGASSWPEEKAPAASGADLHHYTGAFAIENAPARSRPSRWLPINRRIDAHQRLARS
jgi:hypothetical protein